MKIITFGELMLRLAPNGYYRFFQNDQMQATFGGGEANVAVSRQADIFIQRNFQHTSGTVPRIIKSTDNIFINGDPAASGTLFEVITFITVLFFGDGILQRKILFQTHFYQKCKGIHMRGTVDQLRMN